MIEFCAYGFPHYGLNVYHRRCHRRRTGTRSSPAPVPARSTGPTSGALRPDGTPLPGLSFLAYGTSKWGVNVAAGDIDGDGFDEIITGAGPGAVFGPHVRGWNYDDSGPVTAMTGVSYFAYGTPKWGVNVSAGDIDGDGYDEIVTGAGPGVGLRPPRSGLGLRWHGHGEDPECEFPRLRDHQFGVNVSCGDVDGDGIDEIVTAPGPCWCSGRTSGAGTMTAIRSLRWTA